MRIAAFLKTPDDSSKLKIKPYLLQVIQNFNKYMQICFNALIDNINLEDNEFTNLFLKNPKFIDEFIATFPFQNIANQFSDAKILSHLNSAVANQIKDNKASVNQALLDETPLPKTAAEIASSYLTITDYITPNESRAMLVKGWVNDLSNKEVFMPIKKYKNIFRKKLNAYIRTHDEKFITAARTYLEAKDLDKCLENIGRTRVVMVKEQNSLDLYYKLNEIKTELKDLEEIITTEKKLKR